MTPGAKTAKGVTTQATKTATRARDAAAKVAPSQHPGHQDGLRKPTTPATKKAAS